MFSFGLAGVQPPQQKKPNPKETCGPETRIEKKIAINSSETK